MNKPLNISTSQVYRLIALTQNGTTNFVAGYKELLAFIAAAGKSANVLGAGTLYWYHHAPGINDPHGSLPARFFIRDVTDYGERLSGLSGGNTQQLSDAIAHAVLLDVIDNSELLTLPTILGDDISAALRNKVTYGGWGGSFYYWKERPAGDSRTIGQQIDPTGTGAGPEYDKFVAANAAAIFDSTITNFSTTFSNLALYILNLGAEVPGTVSLALFARSIDIYNGTSIVGAPDLIGNDFYSSGKWFHQPSFPIFGAFRAVTQVTDAKTLAALSAERSYRLARQGIMGYSNSDLLGPVRSQTTSGGSVAIGADVGTSVAADGSYDVSRITAGDDGSAMLDSTFHSADASVHVSFMDDVGSSLITVAALDAAGSTVASEDFAPVGGSGGPVLQDAWFVSTGGVWTSADLTFLGDGRTIYQIAASKTDGTSLFYSPSSDGSWTETLEDASGAETEQISYSSVYDQNVGAVVFETRVTASPSGVVTIYANGDPAAPGKDLPVGMPVDFASAGALWNALVTGSPGTASVGSGAGSTDAGIRSAAMAFATHFGTHLG